MDLFLSSNTHYWCFIAEHLWIYSLDQTGYLLWKVRHSAQQFPPVSVKHLVKLPPHFDLCTTDTSYKSDPVNIGTSSAKEDVRGSGFPWPSNQIVQISYITVGMVEGLGHPKSDWLKNLLVIPLSLDRFLSTRKHMMLKSDWIKKNLEYTQIVAAPPRAENEN